VARQPAQHRQHLERAELGEVAHGGDHHLGLEVLFDHDQRRVAARGRPDLGQRRQRRGRLGRIPEHERHQPIDRAHRAHPAERGDRGPPQLGGRRLDDEPGDRVLERREPEPSGGAQRHGGDRQIAIRQPAVHERQQPQVAEPAAHRRDHPAAIRGRIGEPRRLEQRERGPLRHIPLGAQRTARKVAQQARRLEPRAPRRCIDRPHRQHRDGVRRGRLAMFELKPHRADTHVIGRHRGPRA
jgi:hypothetical protein